MFEETIHVGMRGFRRIPFRSVHACGVGGIGFSRMQILEEDPGRIKGFDMFEETIQMRLRGFGRNSILSARLWHWRN